MHINLQVVAHIEKSSRNIDDHPRELAPILAFEICMPTSKYERETLQNNPGRSSVPPYDRCFWFMMHVYQNLMYHLSRQPILCKSYNKTGIKR